MKIRESGIPDKDMWEPIFSYAISCKKSSAGRFVGDFFLGVINDSGTIVFGAI